MAAQTSTASSPTRSGGERRLVVLSHTGLMSGAETVLLRMMRAAVGAGWRVTCLVPPGPFAERVATAGIGVETIPELKLPDLSRPAAVAVTALRSAKAAMTLRRASADADVVLLNGILGLPSLRFARLTTPSAWLVHDVIRTAESRALLRVCGSAADLAVAVSEAVAGPLGRAGLATVVIRNGTEWPAARAPLDHPEPPVVGHVALLTPWKGHRVLLDAVAMLPRRDVVVELAGGSFPKDRAYVEELHARAGRSDLAGRVRFLGQLGDVTERSRTWSLGVVASVDPEAAPLALLEHMSVGLPVVATDHGGSPEVLDGAGLLVPPGDPVALAGAICRLLDDSELRRRCADAGPKQVAAKLTLAHQTEEFLALLERLAGSSKRRS
jgi:glycosyltransferase involved in cell wall biosynthesis